MLFSKLKYSPNTVIGRLAALRFFYIKVLKRSWSIAETPYPRKVVQLPEILSPEEVTRIIDAADSTFHRAMLMTLYATGARRAEAAHLKVGDIDSQRMAVKIHGGKGNRDRDVMLSPKLLAALRDYWRGLRRRRTEWLFPGNAWHFQSTGDHQGHVDSLPERRRARRSYTSSHPPAYAATLLRDASAGRRCRVLSGTQPALDHLAAPQGPAGHSALPHGLLAGHRDRCSDCGHVAISYNSCGNRHCPRCQGNARLRWLQARETELLPTRYVHAVFTLPRELALLALQNKKVIFNLLFHASAATLLEVARDPRHLGAEIRFFSVLHTWNQRLQFHPHTHCILAAGGLSPDHDRWIGASRRFFLPVKVLGRVFRGKFAAGLKIAFHSGDLHFHGTLQHLADPRAFRAWLQAVSPRLGRLRQAPLRRA